MSHPLGPLAGTLTALAVYETGQTAMRHALALVAHARYTAAAVELDTAADAAHQLARMSTFAGAPARATRWERTATQRRAWARQATDAAIDVGVAA